jgi:hypothetical protein
MIKLYKKTLIKNSKIKKEKTKTCFLQPHQNIWQKYYLLLQ